MQEKKSKALHTTVPKFSTSSFHHATQFKQASFHPLACTRMHHFQRHLLWSFYSAPSTALHTVPVNLHRMQPLTTVLSVLEYCNYLSPRMCSFNSMFPHHFTQLSPQPPLIHLYKHTLSFNPHQTKPNQINSAVPNHPVAHSSIRPHESLYAIMIQNMYFSVSVKGPSHQFNSSLWISLIILMFILNHFTTISACRRYDVYFCLRQKQT